jgi:hypothetical protein
VSNNVSAIYVDGTKLYTNTSTVYLYPNATKTGYVAVTGLSKAPNSTDNSIVSAAYTVAGKVVSYVFMSDPDTTAQDMVFFVNPSANHKLGTYTDTPYQTYDTLVNGKLVDTKVKAKDVYADHPVDGVTLNTAGFYTVIKDGEYVVGAAVAPNKDGNGKTLYSSYVGISFKGATDKEVVIAGANEEGYTWTAKTVVAYVTLDSKGFATQDTTVTSVDKITADANDLVWIVPNKAIQTQADAIYIVAVDDSANTALFYTG